MKFVTLSFIPVTLWTCLAVCVASAQCEFNSPKRPQPEPLTGYRVNPSTGLRKLFPIRKELYGDIGFIDRTGKVIFAPAYRLPNLSHTEGPIRAYTHDDVEVFLTEDGKIWQPIKRLYLPIHYGDFSEGLAAYSQSVRSEDLKNDPLKALWGYIDLTGAIKLGPLPVGFLNEFHDGLASARTPDSSLLYGYIDTIGRWKIPPKYHRVGDFSEGLAAIDLCDHCQYIDKDGKQAIPQDFLQCKQFQDGVAQVELTRNHWAFINHKGDVLATLLNDQDASYYQSEGLMPSQKDYAGPLGFVNTQGKYVISPRFLAVEAFSEGLAAVTEDGIHWGYIDHAGKFIIPPNFYKPFNPDSVEIGLFSEGLAFACNKDSLCGYVDKTGKWALAPRYVPCDGDPAGYCDFRGGLAWVRTKQIEGYINPQGHFVWYQKAHPPDHRPHQTFQWPRDPNVK